MEPLKKIAKVIYYFLAVISCGVLLLLVFFVKSLYFYIKKDRLLRSSIQKIDKMSGKTFENYLAVLFTQLGYKVKKTPSSNDYGADLILKKGLVRTIVQAKRYSAPVSVSAVQEIHSAKTYYNASRAWVVSNSTFTKQAKTLANATNVTLIDRGMLIAFSRKANLWR